jgi:glycosyltransferase involved in cell wall biosynthesis
MRVLTFIHSFELGGVERVALRLVSHWRRSGVDAPLFVGREDGPLRAELAKDLRYTAPRQPRIGTAAWETLWMICRLPAEIRRVRPDIVFVPGSTYTVVAVATRLILGRRCPPIVVKISNDLARRDLPAPLRLGWRLWLTVQARCARIWVVMDEAMVADLPAAMAKRCRVIDDPAICEAQIMPVVAARRESVRRFAAVGRLVAQKDYPLMLRAFGRARQPGQTLTIFGDGPERERLAGLAAGLGLTESVVFAGHVPDASARLAEFDALLLSSRYEGVPAAIVEALAAGLPIVATDCGAGVRSLLGGGRFGILAAREVAALAQAIRDVSASPRSRIAPREHVRRFTLECSAERYLAAFEAASRAVAGSDEATAPLRSTSCPTQTTR